MNRLTPKVYNKGVERWSGGNQNKNMESLKFLIGSRSARHKGSGVPSGRLLEVRAVFFLLIALFLGIAGWTWMKKAENYSYASPKIEQISTAAGKN
jgi:polyferredoxin